MKKRINIISFINIAKNMIFKEKNKYFQILCYDIHNIIFQTCFIYYKREKVLFGIKQIIRDLEYFFLLTFFKFIYNNRY